MFRLQYKVVMMGLAMWLATGCKKDNLAPELDRTTAPRTIGEFIKNNYDLSLLQAALLKTGLTDSLAQPGAYTFFAPDNAAFNLLGIGNASDFDKLNTDSLRHVLRYHLLRDRYYVSGFPVQMDNKYITATGEPMYVSVSAAGTLAESREVSVNGAGIAEGAKRNIALSNGVIHLIRKPLQFHTGTVQDYISKDTSLSIFTAAMKRFGYWEGLAVKSPVTVYAPANSAFLSRGLSADSISRMNTADYQELTFGIYVLLLQSRQIFTPDGYLIERGTVYGVKGILFGDYSLLPNFSLFSGTGQLGIAYYDKGIDWWGANNKGPNTVNYKGGAINADHLTNNGLVHVIDNLIFYPELMKK